MNKPIFKVFLTIFLIGNLSFIYGQCPQGDLVLSSQQSVDDFASNYPNCTNFPNRLTIHGGVDITNLNGLSQIESIDGLFIIEGFRIPVDLSGLNNLNTLRDNFFFRSNQGISNFNGLENLEIIEKDFLISDNNDLLDFTGLSSLQTINGKLSISNNFKLASLDGLQSLTSINSGLRVTTNDFLTSFNGLNNLTSIGNGGNGYLNIANNGHLLDLSGLESLTTVNGSIYIAFNVSLNSLNGLNSLTTVNGNFTIPSNRQITTLSALSNLTEIDGNLQIDNIDSLSSLSGLENLNRINGSLTLLFITNLTNIEAIRNLDSSTLTLLQIGGNNQLSQCSVESICDYLSIPVNNANISTNSAGCNTRQEVETACGLIKVEENQLTELKIYPNPTNDTFNISGLTEGNIQIVDSQGRVVKEMNLEEGAYSISELTAGVYFVKITSNTATVTKQIIKT